MSKKEIKYRAKQRRARENAKRRMILLLATVLLVTIASMIFGSSFSSAQDQATGENGSYKYYKSISIKKGDSLWSIAKEYRTNDYDSTEAYIQELREMNHLTSDTIHEGQHLVVAYYEAEYK